LPSPVTFTAQRGLSLLGDEVGAWMADTTAETLAASVPLADDMSVDNTGNWSGFYDSFTFVTDHYNLQRTSADGRVEQASSFVDGKTYIMQVEAKSTAAHTFKMGPTDAAFDQTYLSGTFTTSTSYQIFQFTFIAISGFDYSALWNIVANSNIDYKNFEVRLAVPDLSTADNGLGVYGSITKAAVNTGADLVAYSGFGTSNYLEQPYNADLDFGTGDIGFGVWFKRAAGVTTTEVLLDRNDTSGAGPRCYIQMVSGGAINVRIGSETLTPTNEYDDGEWHAVYLMRISSVMYLFIDGVLMDSVASTSTVTNTIARLWWGIRYSYANEFSGDLALAKATDAPPTAAQIKSIYDKEKHLFRKYSYYTQEGESYSIDLPTAQINPSVNDTSHTSKSADGSNEESLFWRGENIWDIATPPIERPPT